MQKLLRLLLCPALLVLTIGLEGCTIFPEKNPPTLATTTSAEQHERILWQMVQKQQWSKISPIFSTTLVWHAQGKALQGDQVISYLQTLSLREVAIRDVSVRPNGNDMTVSYDLQLSSGSGAAQELAALSVWQQVKGGGYVLVAHSQQPVNASASAATTP